MGLNVTLYGPEVEVYCECDCGHRHKKLTREELYSANITHNLTGMAAYAGVYQALWRPEEACITKARDLITPLSRGLDFLRMYPRECKEYDAKNGWGVYKHFVPFVSEYLNACIKYPDATIEVDR